MELEKSERIKLALEKKKNGHNCAQAVACTFSDYIDLDYDMIKKITQGFGSGCGTLEGHCGALSGAIAILGLINENNRDTVIESRKIMQKFKDRNTTVICKALKGVETHKVIRSCEDCVSDAVEFLEEILLEKTECENR